MSCRSGGSVECAEYHRERAFVRAWEFGVAARRTYLRAGFADGHHDEYLRFLHADFAVPARYVYCIQQLRLCQRYIVDPQCRKSRIRCTPVENHDVGGSEHHGGKEQYRAGADE